jgi:hypothetical protein
MKIAVIASVIVLAGCQGLSLENSIGIDETDNGVLCANVEIRPVWTKSTAVYSRIELPKGQSVTPDQLATLIAACNR